MSVPPCVLLFLSYAYGPSQESVLAPGTDDCDKGATLDCLRALYNFNYDIVSADKEAIGVCECHLVPQCHRAYRLTATSNSRARVQCVPAV